MNSFEPANIEPTGALRPLERQNITESTSLARKTGLIFKAIAALNIRAPSK